VNRRATKRQEEKRLGEVRTEERERGERSEDVRGKKRNTEIFLINV